MLSHSDLAQAERFLRRDDKALRLRVSALKAQTVLIERKTARGRIGHTANGDALDVDNGRRREEGHVLVAILGAEHFNVRTLRETLQAHDTWRRTPLWQRIEAQEAYDRAIRAQSRRNDMLSKAAEFWNRYAWLYKQRVNVPVE